MDILTQVLLCLVFVLSLALYSRLGSQAQQTASTSETGKSGSAKSKSKKKPKKANGQSAPQIPSARGQPNRDVSVAPADRPAPVSEAKGIPGPEEDIEAGKEVSASGLDQDNLLTLRPASSDVKNSELALEEPTDYIHVERERELEKPRGRPAEDTWRSVGKGAARASKHNTASSTSYSSIASSNPFAVLPGDAVRSEAPAARSIAIPASANSLSTKSKPTTSSQKASSSSTAADDLTKRQRQNAARAAAAKQAKEEEEKIRLARLDAHRREAQRERMREEERKKFAKGIRSSAPNGTSNGTESRGNRGGLDSKASVNTKGQLVWD